MGRSRKPSTTQLGQAVRVRRGDRDLRSLAPEVGVSRATLSAVERGEYALSIETTRALAAWLGWSMDEVLAAADRPVEEVSEGEAPLIPPSHSAMHRIQKSLEETAREMGMGERVVERLVQALHRGAVPSPAGPPTALAVAVAEKSTSQTVVEVSQEVGLPYPVLWRALQGVQELEEWQVARLAAWLGWTVEQVVAAARVGEVRGAHDAPCTE